ncbi:hypothetical protein A6770_14835 [Nostoc minutum NIES-26]|uniref:Transketolase n=1 Tax=Nostoc minutum NIES-26 TaxID=1844469 RepID=A0A367RNM2_9NOSO|nr:hypothetical protein A6770_14835 [Nostoc minutum NIES-26]
MSPKKRYWQSLRRIKNLLFLSSLVISITNIYTASAHETKIAADVGATLHVEPNDNPRAGEPTQAWFALTRKGGKAIPLTQCNCRLVVYAQPHTAGEPALLEPSLKPVAAERYQGIPGADIVFPKPGIYQLKLSGKPVTQASFKPFQFKFEVTVVAGSARNIQNVQDVNDVPIQGINTGLGLPITVLAIVLGTGILFFLVQAVRRS